MSDFDDLDGVTQPPISDETAEQLLSGTWSGHEPNSALSSLANLFQAARASGEADELASLDATVVAFRHAVGAQIAPVPEARKRPMLKKLLTAKAAAAIGVIAFATAGAAAATGSLPNPFSSSAPSIESPGDTTAPTDDTTAPTDTTAPSEDTTAPTDETTAPTEESTEPTDAPDSSVSGAQDDAAAQGPDATGPAKFGLCTASGARAKHDETGDSTAPEATVAGTDDSSQLPIPFQNLVDAATAAGQTVDEFCADATPGGKSGSGDSADDNPSATAPGHTADNPSATAPGHEDDDSTSTSVSKSDDASSNAKASHGSGTPADTAPGRSSDQGHGNGNG